MNVNLYTSSLISNIVAKQKLKLTRVEIKNTCHRSFCNRDNQCSASALAGAKEDPLVRRKYLMRVAMGVAAAMEALQLNISGWVTSI